MRDKLVTILVVAYGIVSWLFMEFIIRLSTKEPEELVKEWEAHQ